MERPQKRQRTGGVVYNDRVPFNNDIDVIFSRDATTRRFGDSRRTGPTPRVAEPKSRAWGSATAWIPQDDPEFALDPDGTLYDDAVEGDIHSEDVEVLPVKKARSKVSKRPHVVWMETHRQSYLDELMRWEGRGDFLHAHECADCLLRNISPPGSPVFRCSDCFLPDLLCSACCVKRHRLHPFHRIKRWTGETFIQTSLKDIGLKVQLNHGGLVCESPVPCHSQLRILHTNGIHDVSVQYCGCSRTIPQHFQLLRRGWYPATQITVKTCATFDLLGHLHILALTTKASTYDFYRALERMADGTRMNRPSTRYRALFRMILQWRHLKMLKWGGRGNDPTGVAGTKPGELALRCPSCPYPDINLPAGWQDAPDNMKFLYMLIICMDANFRLKNQLVSNYSQDPGLGTGWAYMIPRESYENYVLSRASDGDISTCVGLQALAKANTKFSKGLRYTGVGAVVCGRSEMILPLGVGNLQKGERYANMDYIFGSAIRNFLIQSFILQNLILPLLILISYDIACQWFINIFKRMSEHWPDEIKIPATTELVPAIPKLHEPMHGTTNHQVYSLNYTPGVGLSDCECPERVWGPHNILGNSTKTQGPGSRHDVLDDHFNFWNWEKYVGLGVTLARKFKISVAQRNIQVEGHRGFTEALSKELVDKWETICIDWEEDGFPKTKINPYQTDATELTEAEVKKELAEEEGRRLAAGGIALHATGPSAFLVIGLDLEDTQRRIRRLAKGLSSSATFHQEGNLAEQRNQLRARIRAWERLQPIYMPGLLQYLADLQPATTTPSNASSNPEDEDLWLPSRIPTSRRLGVFFPGLSEAEDKLRTAQCTDCLENIRHTLKVKSRMVYFKNKNVRGQRDGTRSRSVIDGVHEKARAAAEKYRAARRAKMALSGPGDWEQSLRALDDADLRSYQDPSRLEPRQARRGTLEDDQVELLAQQTSSQQHQQSDGELSMDALCDETRTKRDGTGETRRTLSWIWLSQSRSPDSADETDDILRTEWAKSRARALRSREEVLLVKEEMRRVLEFFAYQAAGWKGKANAARTDLQDFSEGRRAFAYRQARLQEDLADHFRTLWKQPLEDVGPDGAGGSDETNGDDDDDGEGEDDDDDDLGEEDRLHSTHDAGDDEDL